MLKTALSTVHLLPVCYLSFMVLRKGALRLYWQRNFYISLKAKLRLQTWPLQALSLLPNDKKPNSCLHSKCRTKKEHQLWRMLLECHCPLPAIARVPDLHEDVCIRQEPHSGHSTGINKRPKIFRCCIGTETSTEGIVQSTRVPASRGGEKVFLQPRISADEIKTYLLQQIISQSTVIIPQETLLE